MTDLNSQLTTLRQRLRAIITVIQPHQIWEITIPGILKTIFSQTSLILEKRGRFCYLHDNGSCNNTAAFHLPATAQHRFFQLKIKDNVHLVANRYHEISFPFDQPNGLINSIRQLDHFLISADRILRQNI